MVSGDGPIAVSSSRMIDPAGVVATVTRHGPLPTSGVPPGDGSLSPEWIGSLGGSALAGAGGAAILEPVVAAAVGSDPDPARALRSAICGAGVGAGGVVVRRRDDMASAGNRPRLGAR